MAKNRFIQVHDHFFTEANALRQHIEKCFSRPLEADGKRFVWDYWHIKDQYTLLRTPAYHYFPKSLYERFHKHLVEWGQRHLGCVDISPPWLSYYVDGCEQQLHADIPHGPWAFVYSLTPWKTRPFRGGETVILKPETLTYWSNFKTDRGLEKNELVDKIEPHFNRLTVFDPRFPHGVERVHGVKDPLKARMVIHGWFLKPKPFVKGKVNESKVTAHLNNEIQKLEFHIAKEGAFSGTYCFKIRVSSKGKVLSREVLANTLINLENPVSKLTTVTSIIDKVFREGTWPDSRSAYEVTIPLCFM